MKRDRILIGKCFGIGNAVMSIGMIRAIREANPSSIIDVLVGTTSDDAGAKEVFIHLRDDTIIDHLWFNEALEGGRYDVAVMSIPFDGRWQNGAHYSADVVLDGRSRPDPTTTGLVSWKKHEVEYQLENAILLGSDVADRPDDVSCGFMPPLSAPRAEQVYLGLGYKKDAAGFWRVKHWGNENYVELIRRSAERFPDLGFVTTGDALDLQMSIKPIMIGLRQIGIEGYLRFMSLNLQYSFGVVSESKLYVGNDSGMMHVAASCGVPCVAIFNLENSTIKSRPWGSGHICLEGWKEPVTVDQVIEAMEKVLS